MSETNGAAPRPPRPVSIGVDPSGIPPALRERFGWVVWSYCWERGAGRDGRWAKPPFNPSNGNRASVTHPRTWAHYPVALHALDSGKYDGLGLVVGSEGSAEEEPRLFCLDIDDCRQAAGGTIEPTALAIVRRLDTFTEVSPSGTGLHCWFLATLPTQGRRVGSYEIYSGAHYLTVTGSALRDTPPLVNDRTEVAAEIAFELRLISARLANRPDRGASLTLTNEEVIRRCESAPGGRSFQELFRGNSSNYDSPSEADLGFCARLAFYTQDELQILAIWQSSGRWRDKCENPTYVAATIKKAIETQKVYYDPNFRSGRPRRARQSSPPAPQPSAPPPAPPPPAKPPAPKPPPCVGHPAPPAAPPEVPRKVIAASTLRVRPTRWLVPGFIPRGELSLVVGPANSGKSTFATWLLTKAALAVVLPGFEESLEGQFLTRLLAVIPDPRHIFVMPGLDWTLPGNARHLEHEVRTRSADLLLIDPIDSYLDEELSENDQRAVRAALECLVRIAHSTGAAIVCIRHPGKMAGNICPGSRAWRAVPRVVLEFVIGIETPPTRFLHVDKEIVGQQAPDTYYSLVPTSAGEPPRFLLGAPVDSGSAEVARLVREPIERRKLDIACDLLRDLLADGEQEAGWLLKTAQGLGVSPGTLYLACDRLQVQKRSAGGGKSAKHFWVPPPGLKRAPDGTYTGGGEVSAPESVPASVPEGEGKPAKQGDS